jgi:hypothetical protein
MGGTMEGLARPLYGGFTSYMGSATSTAQWVVDEFGQIDQNALHNAAANTASGVNYMEGVHFQTNITTTTGGSTALHAEIFHDSGTCSGQIYAAEFWIEGASGASVGGGRIAAISLFANYDSGYGQVNAASSFINCHAVDSEVPALFTILGATADDSGGLFHAATNTTIDHAMRIYVDNVVYYIGLYDALCT